MIIKSSTTHDEDDLIDDFEKKEELFRLRAKLEAAEQSRLVGEPTFNLNDSRALLKERFKNIAL